MICVIGLQGALAQNFETAGIQAFSCPFPWPEKLSIGSYRLSRWIRHQLQATFPTRFATLLRRIKADLVHNHISSRIDLQARGIDRAKLPWVWTIHGLYKPEGVEIMRWRKAAQSIIRSKGCITADSKAVADDFIKRGFGGSDSIRIVNAGADVVRFDARIPKDRQWRAGWNIPEDAIVFGTSGRLVPVKGVDLFVQASAKLIHGGMRAHFVVTGDGPLASDLKSEILRLGIQDNFHLTGFQADVPRILRHLDVFVLPSRSEGFPLSLIEALAMGLPCIATNVGGVSEMLGDNGGLIVRPDSPDDLANAMRAMLSPPLRMKYAQSGPALAHRYSYENCAASFAEVYANLLRNRNARVLRRFGV
jgi:glycosyltransferase involved in cell wall biosynthesis